MDWGCQHRRFLGGGYLDFPIEGNSIKNDGLNRLITVVTALTYPYKKKSPLFHRCYSEGDAAARARCVVGVTKPLALQTTRSDRNAQLQGVCQLQRFQIA